MENAQDFHCVIPYSIRKDVRETLYDKLPRSRDAAGTPHVGVIRQNGGTIS
jgi:hypothetical protein